MSDYWVSKNKYYCTYCNIYIADDKPSRLAHETGLRHKGNYDRKIREMYKKSERETREKANEAKEIARMEAAAHAAVAKDGLAAASSSTAPPPPPSRTKPKSDDPFAHYSTAADLGFIDKEEEKRKADEIARQAEAEAAAEAEQEARRNAGTIGQWERVVKKRPPPALAGEGAEEKTKVKGEDGEDEEERVVERDEPIPTNRNFLKEKQLADEDEYDPTQITINLKRKRLTLREEQDIKDAKEARERVKREAAEAEQRRIASEIRNATTTAGWQTVDVKNEPMLEFEPLPEVKNEADEEVKDEGADVKAEGDLVLKAEVEEAKPVVASGFKKRKMHKMHGAAAARRKP